MAEQTSSKQRSPKKPQDRKPKQQRRGRREIDLQREQQATAWFEFTYRGHHYKLQHGDLTARESRLLYRELGDDIWSFLGYGRVHDWVIAAIVWIFDRRDDEALGYEEVADDFHATDVEGIKLVVDNQEPDDPT